MKYKKSTLLVAAAIAVLVAVEISIFAFLGGVFFPASSKDQNLGATIPTPVALFETTLASSISSTATSMTLTSATDKDGNALASSTYAFIIDEGTANEEFVVASCTGTACTSMTRGVSVLTGNTSVAALKKSHRRGASVKITDGPQLLILSRILNGDETLPNILSYASAPTFTGGSNELASIKYVDDTAFAGTPDASGSTKGIVEIASAGEAAAGTTSGDTSAPLAIDTSITNETPGANKVVVAQSNSKIKQLWLDLTEAFTFTSDVTVQGTFTTSATTTLAAGTTVGGSAIPGAVDIQTFTSSGTWTKPTAAKYVEVYLIGAGGGGGGGGSDTSSAYGGGGGSGGGYVHARYDASGLGATETVTIGTGGTGGTGAASGAGTGTAGGSGGNTSFGTNLLVALGGDGGDAGSAIVGANGGTGPGGNGLVVHTGGDGADNADGAGVAGDDTAVFFSPRGGGSGGRSNLQDGGAGGAFITTLTVSGGAGGTGGSGSSADDGDAGTTGSLSKLYGGTGGGGGEGVYPSGGCSCSAGAGGAGGTYGGGGGGGGGGARQSSGSAAAGGTGGAGGAGAAVVITYF